MLDSIPAELWAVVDLDMRRLLMLRRTCRAPVFAAAVEASLRKMRAQLGEGVWCWFAPRLGSPGLQRHGTPARVMLKQDGWIVLRTFDSFIEFNPNLVSIYLEQREACRIKWVDRGPNDGGGIMCGCCIEQECCEGFNKTDWSSDSEPTESEPESD